MTGIQWQGQQHNAAGVGFRLGWCVCGAACMRALRFVVCMCVLGGRAWAAHLFKDHELVQEVNTFAGEEFPDGLLSLEALWITGGAQLRRLVSQKLGQREVLWTDRHEGRSVHWQSRHMSRQKWHPRKSCFCARQVLEWFCSHQWLFLTLYFWRSVFLQSTISAVDRYFSISDAVPVCDLALVWVVGKETHYGRFALVICPYNSEACSETT